MTRAAWEDLAKSLARLRRSLLEHAEHSQRTAHMERVRGVDLAARAICSTLRRRYARFDGRRFMRSVTNVK